MKYVVLQSLIGGFPLGAEKTLKELPIGMVSCISSKPNNEHYIKYCKSKDYDLPVAYVNDDDLKPIDEESEKIIEDLKKDNIDIVIGTPYCSGLSRLNTASSSNGPGANAPQNDNMYNLAKMALSWFKPKVYIFENAPALYTKMGRGVLERLREIADEHNFTTTVFKTNTKFHGLPQSRDRAFMYFWNEENKVPVLNYFDKGKIVLDDFLKSIPKTATYYDELISFANKNNLNFYISFAKATYGEDWRTKIRRAEDEGGDLMSYIIKQNDKDKLINFAKNYKEGSEEFIEKVIKAVTHVFKKISTGLGYWNFTPSVPNKYYVQAIITKTLSTTIHPSKDRPLTIREALSLMGFPNDFEMVADKNGRINHNHVSQNVPVNTAADIIKNAVDAINGELKHLSARHTKQTNYKQNIDEIIAEPEINSIDQFL